MTKTLRDHEILIDCAFSSATDSGAPRQFDLNQVQGLAMAAFRCTTRRNGLPWETSARVRGIDVMMSDAPSPGGGGLGSGGSGGGGGGGGGRGTGPNSIA